MIFEGEGGNKDLEGGREEGREGECKGRKRNKGSR